MTIESALAKAPVLMTLTNLRTGETKEVPTNPTELELSFDVNWSELDVPGMSHAPLQYKNTSNVSIPVEFYCSEYMTPGDALNDFERFLQSLAYPDYDANNVLEGAPPRVLVVWPKVVSLTCVIRGLKVRYTHFSNLDGHATRFTASASFSEIRDRRLSAADVRAHGMRRSADSPSSTTPTTGGGRTT